MVVNQTAQVVELAKQVHPVLGTVTLWGLLLTYTGLIAVPIVIVLRMPRALTPPADETGPEFRPTWSSWAAAWKPTPAWPWPGERPARRDGRRGVHFGTLDVEANAIVKQMATTVFLTTAVSQSGRLDALLVLMAQSRMIWRIAHLYYQRPSLREMAHLYTNVAATAFVAGELDDSSCTR